MSIARRLAATVRQGTGVELPVRIRAWDGTEAGPAEGPVLVIRNRRALRRLLWAPGEMGLARAYVTGDVDVEGDMADGFRRAWAMSGKRRASISLRDKVGAGLSAPWGCPRSRPRRRRDCISSAAAWRSSRIGWASTRSLPASRDRTLRVRDRLRRDHATTRWPSCRVSSSSRYGPTR